MQNIRLTNVNKQTLFPLILTAIQTFLTWLVPTLYSHQLNTNIQHTFSNQVLIVLFVFMFNFLIFDRFTNKISAPIFLGMSGIAVLIAALAFSSISPTISLLLFLSLLTLVTFFLSFKTNWAGLILFTVSSAFILPEILFYIQCGFLSTNFLSILSIPTLSFAFFFLPQFIKDSNFSIIIRLVLGVLCILLLLMTHFTTFGLASMALIIISAILQQFLKQRKLQLIINVFLNLVFNLLFFL